MPCRYNDYMLTTRIIVQPNPQDYGATQLIMFNDPSCPDFQVRNLSDMVVKFCKYNVEIKQKGKGDFGRKVVLETG